MPSLLLLLALAARAANAPTDPYASISGELKAAAAATRIKNVSVVPFAVGAPAEAEWGTLVAERLATSLAAGGGLSVLDWSRLEELRVQGSRSIPDETDLNQDLWMVDQVLAQLRHVDAGAFDDKDVRAHRAHIEKALEEKAVGLWRRLERTRMGRPESARRVDALVAGFVAPTPDGRVEVHARLVAPDTALVLGAASAKVAKDWGAPPTAKTSPLALAGAAGGAAAALWLALRSLFG